MASNKFKMYYQNTRGLRTKTHIFKRNVLLNSYDIVSLTETWLLSGINDSELFDDRYVVWRRDRNYAATKERYGGGVLLAVRREWMAVERPEWSSSAEDMWITVTLNNNSSNSQIIHFCTIYLCSEKCGNSFNTQLSNFVEKISFIVHSCPNDSFIVMGDFNLSNILWTVDSNGIIHHSGTSGETQLSFFDKLSECNLTQFNLCHNINNRILDLVLSNLIDLQVSSCSDPLVPEDSHHKSLDIIVTLNSFEPLKQNPRKKLFFESGDYENIKLSLDEINWLNCLHAVPLDEATNCFYKKLYEVIDLYIPHKLITPTSFPPWYNSSLKKVLKEKIKFFHKYCTYGNIADYDTFSLLRKRAKRLEAHCYRSYLKRCEDAIVKNPKLFWSFIKSSKNNPNTIPSSLSYDGQTADSGEDICRLFATYFQSNFLSSSSRQILGAVNSPPWSNDSNIIGDIEIVPETLNKLLKTLDLTKGAGPDQLTPLFISKCADSLTSPLVILFNRSLREGIVPKIWKSAFITPIHKSGARNNIKNYRPISKLCIFAKIFERLVFNQLYNSLSATFIPQQHGFLKNRSTTSNLLTFIDFTTSNMDAGGQVDAIFTDYSKAFDRIDHNILLEKLLFAGVHGNLYRWFTSYIENRSQAVVLNGYSSTWNEIPSGVPQGSLLGPLLFNIFVNDLASCFKHSEFLLYADDMKVFKQITSINDCYSLQDDLSRFEEYCRLNKLDLNVTKCHSITFTRKPKITKFIYTLKNQELKVVEEVRDLGITHDSKLTYDKHIDKIVKKANKSMGFIIRSCTQFSSVKLIKTLFCSYVRSTLEYCSQIWNPQYYIHINRLESIQRKFMRHLQYKCNTYDNDYESRCKRHHMLPLYERRALADVILTMKIAQAKVDSPHLLSKIGLRVHSKSIRQPIYLHVQRSCTNYRKNSFFVRSANQVNKLTGKHEFDIFNTSPDALKLIICRSWLGVDLEQSCD